MLKIAMILSSTRTSRFADKPAKWFGDIAAKRTDASFELIDLRDFPMPFFDEPASSAYVPSSNEVAKRWQEKISEFDGFVFITAEYNHGPTGVLKNALDYASTEWNKKPAAFVGYGAVGAARAIEQLRAIAIELQMAPTRTSVNIQGADFFAAWQQGAELEKMEYLMPSVQTLLEELVWWAKALKVARAASSDQALEAAKKLELT